MGDRPAIFSGLAAFLAVAALPFWYNALTGGKAAAPALKTAPPGRQCVAPARYMKANHMKLLDAWRDRVVREGVREYRDAGGRAYDMSLNRTCVEQCHGTRAEFCDRCHDWVGLSAPECWSCHDSRPNTQRSAR
jgi:hypothetical protein